MIKIEAGYKAVNSSNVQRKEFEKSPMGFTTFFFVNLIETLIFISCKHACANLGLFYPIYCAFSFKRVILLAQRNIY